MCAIEVMHPPFLFRLTFEIGGGVGTNVHLVLENYKNIRKVLYLDIPPNLYVGTQYLKAFYGNAVSDYRTLKTLDSIKFSSIVQSALAVQKPGCEIL